MSRRDRYKSPVPQTVQFLSAMGMVLLTGCMVGPDPVRPPSAAGDAGSYVNADSQPLGEAQLTAGNNWWRHFGDQPTQQVIDQVLAGSTDARAAAARVAEAAGMLQTAEGRLWPQVDLGLIAQRQKRSFTLPEPAGRVAVRDTTYEIGLDVSWQVDLWGKLRRAEQAAWAQLLASEAERQAVLHSLVGEAIRSRVQIATLQRRLALLTENVASQRQTLDVVTDRYKAGLASAAELRLARQAVATAESRLPAVEQSLAQAGHALDVLRGIQPGRGNLPPRLARPLPTLPLPPVGLPAALLDRRPDLRASELRARARTAEIGVEVADLLPSLTLNAGAGLNAAEIGRVLESESFVYTLAANAVQPLFTAGIEEGQIEAAKARASAAAADYAGLVLRALAEVEDALVAERAARDELQDAERAMAEATAAQTLALQEYEQGIGDLLRVLEAQRRRYDSEQQVVAAQAAVWYGRIDLHLALGGDWQVPGPKPLPVPSKENVAHDHEGSLR